MSCDFNLASTLISLQFYNSNRDDNTEAKILHNISMFFILNGVKPYLTAYMTVHRSEYVHSLHLRAVFGLFFSLCCVCLCADVRRMLCWLWTQLRETLMSVYLVAAGCVCVCISLNDVTVCCIHLICMVSPHAACAYVHTWLAHMKDYQDKYFFFLGNKVQWRTVRSGTRRKYYVNVVSTSRQKDRQCDDNRCG